MTVKKTIICVSALNSPVFLAYAYLKKITFITLATVHNILHLSFLFTCKSQACLNILLQAYPHHLLIYYSL